MHKAIKICFVLTAIVQTSCTTMTQSYLIPTGDNIADFTVAREYYSSADAVDIYTFTNATSCTGRSKIGTLTKENSSINVPISTINEFAYQLSYNNFNYSCSVIVAFTPKTGGEYSSNFILDTDKNFCSSVLFERLENGGRVRVDNAYQKTPSTPIFGENASFCTEEEQIDKYLK